MTISGSTRVAAVIGHPVTHSLSPVIHNAAFAAGGLDWIYVALPVVPGAGAAITGLFLKVPPPRGPGMACAAPDVYSYAQVVATSATLTVTPKDAQGRLVREPTGGPCGPFVFRAAR